MIDVIFNIKWTFMVWVITLLTLAVLFYAEYSILTRNNLNWWYFKLPISLVIVGTVVVCFLTAPLRLKISGEQLQICKIGGCTNIPYGEIQEVDSFRFNAATRVFGSGGFFGFTGKFSEKKLGTFTAYIGDTSKTFYVKTIQGKIYAISCEQPDIAIALIKKKIIK